MSHAASRDTAREITLPTFGLNGLSGKPLAHVHIPNDAQASIRQAVPE